MDLTALAKQLEHHKGAPVDQWDPPFCGDLDLVIRASGRWDYQNSPIGRKAMVKLFASVIKQENGRYYLVTPVEKVGIQVEDLPFMVVAWEQIDHDGEPVIRVTTNVDETYLLSSKHPLIVDAGLPAVVVRDGLKARVHRNVYYQWADIATAAQAGESEGYYIDSAGERFLLAAENLG
ncbi:DUF1285 domain-containing protein [Aliidiomarina indica]|uniref:DUF1285 domain-containing protein n=1 Tax=Aliidiomarina indica TaxID=2749147 RepID=UPI00189054C6|nr:DUF1285 domain-containing protein [Aliidiomarina indica]